MWLMTPHGFYSVVAHRDKPTHVLVRARCRQDLERLLDLDDPARARGIVAQTINADYPYRVEMTRRRWENLAQMLAAAVDYPNFKDAVKTRQGAARANVYMSVWGALHRVEQEDADPRVARPTTAPAQLTMSAGGMVSAIAESVLDDELDGACLNCGVRVHPRWDLCVDCERHLGAGVPA